MPQIATQKRIQVAQAETEPVKETGATVQAEKVENPLAEHPPVYYSGIGAVIAIGIVIAGILLTRRMTLRKPRVAQLAVEQYYTFLKNNVVAAIGPGGEKYVPLVATVFTFVLFSNLMGALPTVFLKSGTGMVHLIPAPTSNLSMTVAIALVVFVVVQYVGIKENGFAGYIKHFMGPIPALAPLLFPLELIGAIAKPVSLAIRLFGNVFGEETIIAVLATLAAASLPWFLPIPYQAPMLAFGVFGAIVQASVFSILTCAYISLSIGEHGDGHGDAHGHTEEDEFGARVPAH